MIWPPYPSLMPVQSIFTSCKPQLRSVQRRLSGVDGFPHAIGLFAPAVHHGRGKAFYSTATNESTHLPDHPSILVTEKKSRPLKTQPPASSSKSTPKKKTKFKATKSIRKSCQSQNSDSKDRAPTQETSVESAGKTPSATGHDTASKQSVATKQPSTKQAKKRGNVKSQSSDSDGRTASAGDSDEHDRVRRVESRGRLVRRLASRNAPIRRIITNDSPRLTPDLQVGNSRLLGKRRKLRSSVRRTRVKPRSKARPRLSEKRLDANIRSIANGSSSSSVRTLKEALLNKGQNVPSLRTREGGSSSVETITASQLNIKSVDSEMLPVPGLAHGLDRVLFNPGVYHLQDPRSRVFNFDPYLQMIMPVAEFDFNALKRFVASSEDDTLATVARQQGSKYVGSTSSMTSVLSHFHYLLSQWRDLNLSMLSKGFEEKVKSFTQLSRGPAAIMLRWKNGTYAIDADKEFDSPTILAMLGKSMEKLMVLPTEAYERYRKSDPRRVSDEERTAAESYHYSTLGDVLMRSQLDAHDPRLPGTGMFDIKTRAVVSVRMSSSEYEDFMGYQIRYGQGRWESFEREYYDMMRSTMLKYSLQARIGRMDGVFAAYHNIERIFGFQYISLSEMDRALHGQEDTSLGDQEFKVSLDLLNKVLNRATEKFPDTSLRLHFETREASVNFMYIFVEPVSEEEVNNIQQARKEKIEQYERSVLGLKPEDENDEKENAKDWESIMAQVKNEIRNDEIDSGEKSSNEIDGGESQSISKNVYDHQISDGLGENEGKVSEGDMMTSRSEPTQQEATADAAETQSSSKADQEVMSDPSLAEARSPKPILAMTLTTRSRVNGRYRVRPVDLMPNDDWQVEYSITEVASQARAWNLYEMCKRRRKNVLPRENPDDRVEDYYMQMMRRFSERGREWRNKMDEWESQRQTVVFQAGDTTFGNARPTSQEGFLTGTADTGDSDAVHGVDDYLRRIYGVDNGHKV